MKASMDFLDFLDSKLISNIPSFSLNKVKKREAKIQFKAVSTRTGGSWYKKCEPKPVRIGSHILTQFLPGLRVNRA